MKSLDSVQYLRLNKFQRAGYQISRFFTNFPSRWAARFKKLGNFFKNLFWGIVHYFQDLYKTFVHGDWKTKVSYVVMGFGSIARGQIGRGIIFLVFEIAFILYMVLFGGSYIGQLGTLGTNTSGLVWDPTLNVYVQGYGDNSFMIMLYGVLSLFFIVAFLYTWNLNIKQNRVAEEILENNKKLATSKDDLRAMVDQDFYKTLLALPLLGIVVFTILPIVFMVLVAFTNYDASHQPPAKLFTWVGFDNFAQFLQFGDSTYGYTFANILLWTLIWAFFATFTNYFLGMLVAMLINKKGIKLKKVWRTVLVFSIAIPQFVCLLYVSKMFSTDGIVNGWLAKLGWISEPLPFWTDATLARVSVIVVNIWIGIPYLMLITTGILMNIPKDLYESAKIDGASPWKQYTKITLPYMLFVTGPYLLTSFVSNINNFNVIYLLTNGDPTTIYYTGGAGQTDILITWLFALVVDNDPNYALASVIGILVFLVVAILSLVVYNIIPSTKNEEDFQ